MKFKFRKNIIREPKGSIKEYYQLIETEGACSHIKSYPIFCAGAISSCDLIDEGLEDNNCIKTEDGQTVIGTFFECREVDEVKWDDGFMTEQSFYFPVKVCPICGEKFEIEITETADITEEVERLYDEIHTMESKLKQTTDAHTKRKLNIEMSKKYLLLDSMCQNIYFFLILT